MRETRVLMGKVYFSKSCLLGLYRNDVSAVLLA